MTTPIHKPIHKTLWHPLAGHARPPGRVALRSLRGEPAASHAHADWNGFALKFDELLQQRRIVFDPASAEHDRQEAELTKAFVRAYFDHQPRGSVRFVKHVDRSRSKSGSSYRRIEILRGAAGDWVPVWEDELE